MPLSKTIFVGEVLLVGNAEIMPTAAPTRGGKRQVTLSIDAPENMRVETLYERKRRLDGVHS